MPSQQSSALLLLMRRLVVAAAAVLFVALLLGCMNICLDHAISVGDEGVLCQRSSVTVPGGAEQDVFYPIPYGMPPNLTVKSTFDDVVAVGQFPDHFRVKNTSSFPHDIDWEAKGQRVAPAPIMLPVTTVPTPVQALPAAPVPVNGQ